jgi:maltooligosyltrehalose trehalohydrolase
VSDLLPVRGARVRAEGGVRFSVWAPRAERVAVRRLSTGDLLTLDPQGGGVHAGVAPDARAGEDYVYVLDGARERPDPASRHQPSGVHGPSRVVDPGAHAWSDSGWRGVQREELVLYELHVGTFTPDGTFDACIPRLSELRELGVTALEIMPVAEFPGRRNWGYDGVFPYAPQSTYGGPDGLRRLVDAAHREGLAVLLDVVYNHLGPEGNVLPEFAPYFTERHRTPWGAAIDFSVAEVRSYFVRNALEWLEDFHLDGLRLDAVHAIFDSSRPSILAVLAREAHALADRVGRPLHVIAESDANDPTLVRRAAQGGMELDGVWSDDFHHAIHAALTGERSGYYVDFGGVEPVAKAFRDRFVFEGAHSRYRGRARGSPARDVPADRFVVFAQNHDQVGNRARGERLGALVCPERLRLAAALVLLSPYVPLLFMGEEYGERAPFLYFVDHGDPKLLEAVRRGRREEFRAFEPAGDVPDPGAEETFRRSILDWKLRDAPGHRELLALHRDLLALRRELPALRPGAGAVEVSCDPDAGWLAAAFQARSAPAALAAFQLAPTRAESVRPPGPQGPWRLRLSTVSPRYAGPGSGAPSRLERKTLELGPHEAVLYVQEVS